MAFPTDWVVAAGGGLRKPSGIRSARVFIDWNDVGVTTTAFADRAFAFRDLTGATPYEQTVVTNPGDETATIALKTGPTGGTVYKNHPSAAPGSDLILNQLWCRYIQIWNVGGTAEDLLVSFDGVTTHARIPAGETILYPDRFEAGISLSSASGGVQFYVEGW
jgi:hypothetical protein